MEHINYYMHVMHHDLDIKPVPEQVLYINEPNITGDFCGGGSPDQRYAGRAVVSKYDSDTASWYAEQSPDHIRVYVPLDLSKDAILNYFKAVLDCFGRADEENEMAFSGAVDQAITRLEIYDQVWFTRELSKTRAGKPIDPDNEEDRDPVNQEDRVAHHSQHATEIVRAIVDGLAQLAEDGCTAECFPYETIDMLCKEYGFEQPL